MKRLYETTEENQESVDSSTESTETPETGESTDTENPDEIEIPEETEPEPIINCDGFNLDDLTTNYMFGISLVDQQGNPFPKSLIASYLNGAISWAEQLFDICLTERVVTEEYHDYFRNDYMNWGYLQSFKKPVREVIELKLMYGSQPSFVVPLEWLKVDKMAGKIQMFPSQGSANNLIISQSGVIFGLQQRWSYAPQMWNLSYVAGMKSEDIPENLKILIYKKSAIDIFTVWGKVKLYFLYVLNTVMPSHWKPSSTMSN